MKAMIFAAGLGTRLAPLTFQKPKALVEINGVTLLEILIKKLIGLGIHEIIINVHHFSGQVVEFIKEHRDFGINITISDESDQLLETGGGIKKASWYFDETDSFLAHNVDVITDLDINAMYRYHTSSKALATLAVKKRQSSRYLLFNQEMELCGWEHLNTGEKIITRENQKLTPFAFSGVHFINPQIFQLISEEGKFSIISSYLRLAKGHLINAYDQSGSYWLDVGKPENIKVAEELKSLK